jgi:phosphatidylserine decarboxylase
MAKTLSEWLASDVKEYRDKPVEWLSQYFFFRDPPRPMYTDSSYFFSPADGVVLYQKTIAPDEPLVMIKGKPYTLRTAFRSEYFNETCLVTGIFMTFYDVHINRVPYSGRLSYRLLDPIDTFNHPMLGVEHHLLADLGVPDSPGLYLRYNERVLNRVHAFELGQSYYILQIADYDVDAITPFELRQNQPCHQGTRFSQIRYGSQVDLVIPLSQEYDFLPLQGPAMHVEAGVDPVVAIRRKWADEPVVGDKR